MGKSFRSYAKRVTLTLYVSRTLKKYKKNIRKEYNVEAVLR